MYKVSYDLHIHSCLSPCGDEDMTPGNIVGMAAIKELNVIALTDHNSSRNCPPFLKHAECFGIIAIPGMELCTREEVHVLCLFEELQGALEFDTFVYEKLFKVHNNEEIFGRQLLINERDEVSGKEEYLLVNAADIGFDEVYELVKTYEGIMIPAHIDKSSNSLLSNLGFIPPDSRFTCAEATCKEAVSTSGLSPAKAAGFSKEEEAMAELKRKNPYLQNCRIINNSDAHYLEHIHEPVHFLQIEEMNRKGILKALVNP